MNNTTNTTLPTSKGGKYVNKGYNKTLHDLIKDKFVNITRFARHLGVTRSFISLIVNGKYNPTNEWKIRLSKEFGVDSRTLFQNEKES